MSHTFKPGEIALLVFPSWTAHVKASEPGKFGEGTEVTVLTNLMYLRFDNLPGGPATRQGYKIQTPDGKEWGATPDMLRKKKPPGQPREQLGEWELCPWRPKHRSVSSTEVRP